MEDTIPEVPDVNELLAELDAGEENETKTLFTFNLRDNDKVIIPLEELESIFFEETFFGGLIRSSSSNLLKNSFDIWEDKKTFMSVIDSVRHNQLIIYEGVNHYYLKSLFEKWCISGQFVKELSLKLTSYSKKDLVSSITKIINNFECKNCKTGFDIRNNTDTSCKYRNDNGEEIVGMHAIYPSSKEGSLDKCTLILNQLRNFEL